MIDLRIPEPRVLGKLALVCLPMVISVSLVFWNLQSLGLSHWDEYNYITTAIWFLGRKGGVFTIYEPPGFPFFVALFFKMFGVRDYVAIATSGIFAVATVALVTFIGVRLFGFEVGVTAPILLVLSSLFLSYSRMALTDMAFTFFFTASVFAGYVALKSGKPTHLALASVLFAACSGVKYNGFMALLIPILYTPIMALTAEKRERTRKALRYAGYAIILTLPSLALGLLFLLFLGIGGSVRNIIAFRFLGTISIETLARGWSKFQVASLQYHAGQLTVLPLSESYFYLRILFYSVPLPSLLLAILGMGARKLKDNPQVLTSFWFLLAFLEISSIPSHYSRALLPVLPPLALLGGVGITRLQSQIGSSILTLGRLNAIPKLRAVFPLVMLIFVIAMGLSPLTQTLAMSHNSYREAGQILDSATGNSIVLAETQPVIAFYHPVRFGGLTEANLANASYLIVDFTAVERGLQPRIQLLQEQGRLKLVASVHNDEPVLVYLDSMSFEQLNTWNYTDIQIYRIQNVTLT